jgi:hypothetical protein
MSSDELPETYRDCIRTLLRFAAVMTIVGLLSGVLFQESSKKLPHGAVDEDLRTSAILRLALVHGHVLVSAVLIPIACGGALLLASRVGGRTLGRTPLCFLTRGYLPLISVSLALMLYKAYHVLLSVRRGEHDLEVVDHGLFGGLDALRIAAYALSHAGMAIGLGVFAVALFRSLRRP